MSLRPVSITLAEANAYVLAFHRHAGGLPAARFAVAAADEHGDVRGVAIGGNAKARGLDSRGVLEVNRVCTEGYYNACSFLYARCRRAAKELGYWRAYTYTTDVETGASLRADGWVPDAETGARDWAKERGAGRAAKGGPRIRWRYEIAEPPPDLTWPDELTVVPPPSLFDEVAA